MKTNTYLLLILSLLSWTLFSCEMRDELKNVTKEGPTGKVELHLFLQNEEATGSRSGATHEVADFVVQILDTNGEIVREFPSYASIESIELPAGDYTVRSASYAGEMEEATWNKPFYLGETAFTVKANESIRVDNACTRHSTQIELQLGDDFLNAVLSNYAITLTNKQGVLTLNKDNYGTAYFKPSASINIVIRATTTEGKEVYKSFNVTNSEGMIKPSDNIEISLGAKEAEPSGPNPNPGDPDPNPDGPDPNPDNPDPVPGGSYGSISITIDVTMNGRDEDIIITYPDQENPDPGEEIPSPGAKPAITGTGTKTFTRATAAGASVKIGITTSSAIQNLMVTIDSPFLTPDELGGLGIPVTFDLANLPSDLNAAFKELGLIGNDPIKGAQSTSFDISTFIALLTVDTHRFHISATDREGQTTSSSLTIIITE